MKIALENPNDRLGVMLVIAAIVHGLILLGMTFNDDASNKKKTATMLEITLAKLPSQKTPKDYDYLAQANQDGGGESDQRNRPEDSGTALSPDTNTGEAPLRAAPTPTPEQNLSSKKIVSTQANNTDFATVQAEKTPETESDPAEIVAQRMEIAQLETQYNQQKEAYAKRPKKKTINSRTKAHSEALYMNKWIQQVERVGNLNYPDQARRKKMAGWVILNVAVYKDGSVRSITLERTSGFKVLDDAAIRIVQMASPFDAFDSDLAKEADIINIVRAWEFSTDNEFKRRRQ